MKRKGASLVSGLDQVCLFCYVVAFRKAVLLCVLYATTFPPGPGPHLPSSLAQAPHWTQSPPWAQAPLWAASSAQTYSYACGSSGRPSKVGKGADFLVAPPA